MVGLFEIVFFLCFLYVVWRIVDRFLKRANVKEAIDKVDGKIQIVRETKNLISKSHELRKERRDLEKEKKIYDLENENEEF